MKSMKKVVNLK